MIHDFNQKYKNVFVRPLKESDIEYLRIWRNNKENTKFLRKIPEITKEQQMTWYKKLRENADYYFGIEENEKLHRLVGSASLYNVETEKAEFGRILIGDEEAHGLKVGVNATITILNIAFRELGLNKVYLHVHKDNIYAIKVYNEAGFKIAKESSEDEKSELVMEIEREDIINA